MINTGILKRLKLARLLRGFSSTRAFAKYYNIPFSTYAQHESGCRSMSITCLLEYCELLQIQPGWIICNIGKIDIDSAGTSYQNEQNNIKQLESITGKNKELIDVELLTTILIRAAPLLIDEKIKTDAITFCYKLYDDMINISIDKSNINTNISLAINSMLKSLDNAKL